MPNYDIITYKRPDDVVINLSDLPYTVHAYDGFGIGEFEHTSVAPPQTHGEYWYDTRMSAKVMTIEFSYTANSEPGDVSSSSGGVPEEQASRRSVISMFNPLLGPGILRIDQVSGASREIRCILAESLPLPKEEGEGPGYYRAVVRFKSHGIPAFIDPVINTFELDFTLNPGNFTFPWSFPRIFAQSGFAGNPIVTNMGDIETPVRIDMVGPMSDPIFRNNTTDKTISLTGFNLIAGQHLVIDTDPERYIVQIDGSDAWQYVNDIEMWGLAPGNNQLTFDLGGTTPSTIGSVEWYTRYLGV